MKCYLSDDLASDSEDEKQLNMARRQAASNKRKREANKLKYRKKQFRNVFLFRRNIKTFSKSSEGQSSYRVISEHQKYVISAEKKDISSMTVPFEEQDNFDFTYKREWEITEKPKNVSVRGRLKQNIEFWKNELNPSYFVENIINNGYIMPFTSIPSPF